MEYNSIIWLIAMVIGYFLPAVIACSRSHHSWMAITAVNILLGWTFLGWIIAFVWSLTGVRQEI